MSSKFTKISYAIRKFLFLIYRILRKVVFAMRSKDESTKED